MKLILARHGNTFLPGQKSVWVGARENIPLVESGRAQAIALGESFKRCGIVPARIFCSELIRTQEYAQIVRETLGASVPIKVESRLHELDYGPWGGLSTNEVEERFGPQVLHAWETQSRWPEGIFAGSESQVCDEVRSFFEELKATSEEKQTTLVVSSNGRLRYFLKLIDGEFEKRVSQGSFKMKTGYVGKLIPNASGGFQVKYWNENPAFMKEL